MTAKVLRGGVYVGLIEDREAIRSLAIQHARLVTAAVVGLTNNIVATGTVVSLVAPVVNVANASTNLADKTEAEAAAVTVKNAIREVAARLNAYRTPLGLPLITDNTGGTAADATIANITTTVVAAATGIQAAETNVFITAVNKALYSLWTRTNEVARALGATEIDLTVATDAVYGSLSTLPVLATGLGTAASPGVSKVAFDAVLLAFAKSLDALADQINTLVTAADAAPLLIAG